MAERLSIDEIELKTSLSNLGYGNYTDKLNEEGIKTIQHLKDIDDEDIVDITTSLNMNPEEIKGFQSLCSSMNMEMPWNLNQLQQRKENLFLEYKLFFKSLTPETKTLGPIDTTATTYFQLVQLICEQERALLKGDKTVELYSIEGYPLACSPDSLMYKLNRWHLEEYPQEMPFIYAIPRLITYSDSYLEESEIPKQTQTFVTLFNTECELDQKLPIDISKGQVRLLFEETQKLTGIPGRLIKFKKGNNKIELDKERETLKKCRILKDTYLEVIAEKNYWLTDCAYNAYNFNICKPTWSRKQSVHGINMFYSTLYCVASWLINNDEQSKRYMVLGYLRKLTTCSPLIHALYVLFLEEDFTMPHRVAIQEVMFLLFKEIQPRTTKNNQIASPVLEKRVITEYSQLFWAHILSNANTANMHTEFFDSSDLTCFMKRVRMRDPVEYKDEKSNITRIVDKENLLYHVKNANFKEHGLLQRLIRSFSSVTINAIVWKLSHQSIELQPIDLTYDWPNDSNLAFGNNTLDKTLENFPFLSIQLPLHVKYGHCPKPCLITLENGYVGVYVDQCKTVNKTKSIAYSATEGKEIFFDADELDGIVKQIPAEAQSGYRGAKMTELTKKGLEAITRDPVELIFVLLDISGSMKFPICSPIRLSQILYGLSYFRLQDEKTKYDLAKEALWAFSGRTQAYNLHHMIGLIGFGDTCKLIFPLSESFSELEKEFEKDLPSESATSLYDTIGFAVEQFNKFNANHPQHKNVPRRIICITDGLDNNSKLTPLEATRMVIENKVIVDNILICGEAVAVHGISKASGGYSFKFDSVSSEEVLIGLKNLFEEEPMLTLNCRASQKSLCDINRIIDDMFEFQNMDYDKKIEHIMPENLGCPVVSAETCLSKAMIIADKASHELARLCVKRILQELSMYIRNPHPGFRVFPCEETIQFWQILLVGPNETNYDGGVFKLFIEFSDDYPKKPPNIKFITPIYHCNVNRVGRICHASLDRKYKSSLTIRQIFDNIYGLLMKADPEDPLDSVLADEMRFNKYEYDHKAKEMTKQLASKPINQVVNELIGNREYPSYLVCPLTKTIFIDPVVAHGITYEKSAILEHLRNGNFYHPFTLAPLEETDLAPNTQLIGFLSEWGKTLI